ncbi:hypothetical protein C0J52_05735 [Blattella germanica]|nr:hypothetical protein C0J52_05735 [Blattella germanica]
MECEVRALRRELEETRTALRLQTVRCRQLVAAFTTKLQEKEVEVRAGRELRDRQLGRVLRALLIEKAELAKKQVDETKIETGEIQTNETVNGERVKEESEILKPLHPAENHDDSTSSQEDEISRRPPILQGTIHREFKPSHSTAFVRFKKNGRNFGSYRPISRRREMLSDGVHACRGFDVDSQDLDDSLDNGCQEDEFGSRDLYKDYQHNPVLECVNQILLRDQEEMESAAYRKENKCKHDSKATARFNYQCHSIKEEQDEDASSEEEEVETRENGGSPSTESQSSSLSENIKTSSDKDSGNEQGKESGNEALKWSMKEKTPSPPIKAQLLEEKACLFMASHRLTIVRNLEFEELDKKDTSESVAVVPPPPPAKNGFSSNKSIVPPALPPKPPQLGAKGLYQKKMNNIRSNQSPHPVINHQHNLTNGNVTAQDTNLCSKYRSEQIQDVNKNHNESSEAKNSNENTVKPILHHDGRILPTHHISDKPRQRQILSNGSLKLALNQDSSHDLHQENNNFCITSPTFEEKLDNLNLSELQNRTNSLRHQHRNGGQSTLIKSDNHVDAHPVNRHIHSHEQRRTKAIVHNHSSSLKGSMEELSTPPKTPPAITKNNNHCGKIRVGSSVSSLITGSSGNSIVNELTKGETEAIVLPKVSQIVRRFEDLGTGNGRDSPDEDGEVDGNDALRRNFEEFKLEDVDMDSVGSADDGGRPAGDGAEARAAVAQNGTSAANTNGNGGSYEHFLEATGLSQKSILTPSRMYSNHRNVLKPKDVKHRSKVLRAAAVSEKNNGSNGPVVKYWIEPFL